MSWKNSRCVVTGGAGFIGSHIAQTLAQNGAQVTIIDNLSTGRRSNLESLLPLGVNFVEGSILDSNVLDEAFINVEYVFHQAAFVSVPRSLVEPKLCCEVNVTGTLNVLEASRHAGVKKVVYAASSSVYGETPKLPKVETMHPSPLSPYAISKLTGENYCTVYNSVYNLPTTSLRYFNIYGPRQDPSSQYAAVIPNFITSAINGDSPIIYGDGRQSRDFTFVSDAVQANLKAALSPRANGKVINVAGGRQTTINDLAKIIIKQFGIKELDLVHKRSRQGDIRHSLADISIGQEIIGYEPQYSLEKGIRETVKYFNQN